MLIFKFIRLHVVCFCSVVIQTQETVTASVLNVLTINPIKTINVIPTINVIEMNDKCNTNHKCNKN